MRLLDWLLGRDIKKDTKMQAAIFEMKERAEVEIAEREFARKYPELAEREKILKTKLPSFRFTPPPPPIEES